MIPVFYFRSSSWGTHSSCEMQYYLQYILGFDNPATIKASKGNVTHKALECLANYKLCLQNGTKEFIDDGLGLMKIEDCHPDNLIKLAYDYYKRIENYHNWNDDIDLNDCRDWMYQALRFQNGLFDPRNRKIVTPEQTFDIEIEKDWAKFDYKLAGKHMRGRLCLKGSMDLLTEVRPGIFELIDWKTGATRNDFATGKKKNFYSLHNDHQLRLYHYAVHKLYPEIDNIIITIYFIRCGGPFSLMLSKEDIPQTEILIKNKFEKVKKTIIPRMNPGPEWSKHPCKKIADFKCHKLCHFAKPSKQDPSKTICQFMGEEIRDKGIGNVTNEYADLNRINKYGSGGGRQATQ